MLLSKYQQHIFASKQHIIIRILLDHICPVSSINTISPCFNTCLNHFDGSHFNSVPWSCWTLCNPTDCMQHARPPCPSPNPGARSNSCPLSQLCHPTISSSVGPFLSCLQSFPASGSFPMSQFFFTSSNKILEFQLQHQSFQ